MTNKEFIKYEAIQMTEPKIIKLTRKSYRASFKMKIDSGMTMVVDLYAPSKERLEFKIKHLKETGIFLRD